MQGRRWHIPEGNLANEINSYLLKQGGNKQTVKSEHEDWCVKFSDSTFTFYRKGTLYGTPSNSKDPAVYEAWKYIDSLLGSVYVLPSKDFLIGLDETGKGEVIGHTVLTGLVFPKEIYHNIDIMVGTADTKKRHDFDYWDEIYKDLDKLRSSGLDFVTEKIPPWHVDIFNLNKIMDITYQRILVILFRRIDIKNCRIVLDDYGIGPILNRFLVFLQKQGAEVLVSENSEDKYLEAKAASLISKRTREAVMRAINKNERFKISGISVGSGNAGDKRTIAWLKMWYHSRKGWPWFVKRSFKTIRNIEGKKEKIHKCIPPIKEDLLSPDFIEKFNEGHLSIQSLALICPNCGNILKSATFANYEKNGGKVSTLKCPSPACGKFIENAGITIMYYCGYVVPDSSAILRCLISNDLKASGFFTNFTVVLSAVVRSECDGTSRGRREFEELRRYSEIGRIRLEICGKVADLPANISGTIRDEKIVDDCLSYNAMLVTADKPMTTFAVGRNVFTIFV